MSAHVPRRSTDNPGSPRSNLSTSQYAFSQLDSLHRPASRDHYGTRRGSTASTATSIGGVLDSAAHAGEHSITEAENNGNNWHSAGFGRKQGLFKTISYFKSSPTPNCPYRSSPANLWLCDAEAPIYARHPSSYLDQHTPCRFSSVPAISKTSWLTIRRVPTRKRRERGWGTKLGEATSSSFDIRPCRWATKPGPPQTSRKCIKYQQTGNYTIDTRIADTSSATEEEGQRWPLSACTSSDHTTIHNPQCLLWTRIPSRESQNIWYRERAFGDSPPAHWNQWLCDNTGTKREESPGK